MVKDQGRETYIKVLRKVLKYAVDNELRDSPSPYNNERLTKSPAKPRRFLSENEIKVLYVQYLFSTIQSNHYSLPLALYLFAFSSNGMRFTDVIKLKWGNIQNSTIQYNMSKTKKTISCPLSIQHLIILFNHLPSVVFKQNSTGKNLTHLFKLKTEYENSVKTIIRGFSNLSGGVRYSEENNPYEILADILPELIHQVSIDFPNEYIFHNHDFQKMNILSIYNKVSAMNALVNKGLGLFATTNNLKHFSFHSNRHSFSNYALSLGWNSFEIMKKLGHSSLNETQKYLDAFVDANSPQNFNYVQSVFSEV
jgi:integrase